MLLHRGALRQGLKVRLSGMNIDPGTRRNEFLTASIQRVLVSLERNENALSLTSEIGRCNTASPSVSIIKTVNKHSI